MSQIMRDIKNGRKKEQITGLKVTHLNRRGPIPDTIKAKKMETFSAVSFEILQSTHGILIFEATQENKGTPWHFRTVF